MGGTAVKSLYGSVMLVRSICPECGDMAIVLDGEFQCCGFKLTASREKVKRMTEGELRRHGLSQSEKEEILGVQDRRCFYCGCELDNSWYLKPGMKNPRRVKTHFDHIIPWSYSRETVKYGMVASCSICNLLKGSRCFDDVEEAVRYILARRSKKGILML